MRFSVLVLGNSSATPIYERHPTSQVVNHNEQLYLIDCGEGTQIQLTRYGIKSNRINHIFISHLHGDHYLGLVGLVSSMHLMGRKSDLHLYGPAPLQEILALNFKYSETELRYNLIFHPTNPDETEVIFESKLLRVESFPLRHRIACTGFRFQEGVRPAKLNMEKVAKLEIPPALLNGIKWGLDFTDRDGQVYPSNELTTPAPVPRSYAYCSDTVRIPDYLPAIHGANLLYHESTFLHEMKDRAVETFHTTSLEAGEIAAEAAVGHLLLGHYSARYKTKELTLLLDEARSAFPQSELSVEGKWYDVV
ncbi:ribonuclease Z [Sphingobacterium sp. lm-10]|uniref:ribonuclease Z n=1 Tax=Sphingobacterium sp. lm-10 TaxID=2944904 RepID=UPI0020218B5F|nr:ribonuclease Z [Sphingobacterium sp. lm-10]MCL7989379.1 ribonuclease Z [Sphingobacterium sp. lm-10]